MNVLYGSPQNMSRITLDEIPTDPIIERIKRLALLRREELQTILQCAPDPEKYNQELSVINNILSGIEGLD